MGTSAADSSLTHRPAEPSSHFEAARDYIVQGKAVAARQEFLRAQEFHGSEGIARLGIGSTLLMEERLEEASQLFQATLEPGDFGAEICLAASMAKMGEKTKAREVADAAPSTRPAEPHVGYALALCLAHAGHHDKAIAECIELLNAYPGYSAARYLLGQTYQKANKNKQAEACFRRLYEEDPHNLDYLYSLGSCLYHRQAYDEAEPIVRQALREGLRDPRLYELTGALLAARLRYSSALKMYQRIVNLPAFRNVALENIAYCLYRTEAYREVLAFVDSLLSQEQDLFWCVFCRAEALFEVRGCQAALPYYRHCAQLARHDPDTRSSYILTAISVAVETGKDSEDIPALIAALRRDFPSTGHADYLAGRQALLAGQFPQAFGYLTGAVQKSPNHAEAWFSLGETVRQATRGKSFREMCAAYRQAIRLQPRHYGAWWWLAMAAALSGNRARARDLVERAVRAGCRATASGRCWTDADQFLPTWLP